MVEKTELSKDGTITHEGLADALAKVGVWNAVGVDEYENVAWGDIGAGVARLGRPGALRKLNHLGTELARQARGVVARARIHHDHPGFARRGLDCRQDLRKKGNGIVRGNDDRELRLGSIVREGC